MNKGLDVICLGAINYDYMFHCKAEDIELDQDGDENLGNTIEEVEADIDELLQKRREYSTQIGGSAFITLKVAKHILPDLKVAYVGVCGEPNGFDHRFGKSNNIEAELAHLDDREYLFTTKERFDTPYNRSVGKSVVRLYNHTRNCIKITACANSTIRERIEEKEAAGGNFVEYLSQAKWIHFSSLSDFYQFEANMKAAIEAKKLNPNIKISLDPGFEFTSKRQEELRPLVQHVDYIFLNKAEKNNLGKNEEGARELYQNLCAFFAGENENPAITLIVKYDDRHEIINFEDRKAKIQTIRHTKLYNYQLNNDTGAGDSLAGGFIAGMMDERVEGIEGAIQIGVLAAKGRMTSFDYENPYLNIQKLTNEHFANLNQ